MNKGTTTITKFARYVVVGVASNVTAYLAYLGLTAIGVPYVLAMTLVYCMALIFSFSINRQWTFQDTGAIDKRLIMRYLQCYGLGYIANAVMLVVLVTYLGVSHKIAQACLIIIIACGLFQAQRKWVFVAGQGAKSIAIQLE